VNTMILIYIRVYEHKYIGHELATGGGGMDVDRNTVSSRRCG
jgi:hypothetical protein